MSFSSGRVLQLDNLKTQRVGQSNFKKWNLWKQDKGKKLVPVHSSMPLEIGAKSDSNRRNLEINRISIDLQNSGC